MYTLHPPPIVHTGNVAPKHVDKIYQCWSLPRNFVNRHSMGSSKTPRNFNLNLNNRISMPANNNYNILRNIQQHLNRANHANRTVSTVENENGLCVVTIPASHSSTRLLMQIPQPDASEFHNSYFNLKEIRRKSKAYNARLQEGDELVSVNGRDCRNFNRDVTMSYVDGAKESLDLEVIRRDKNFNTVNTSPYSISNNNNSSISTGKPATIQLVPSGTFQAPGRQGAGSSVRQTTNVQSRIIPVERTQAHETITRTVRQRVGDGDEKTSTTTEYRTFGSQPGGETTTKTFNAGVSPRPKSVVFQPSQAVGNAKPALWSPGSRPQQRQPEPIRAGQKTTIHLQGSLDESSQMEAKDLSELIPSQSTHMPSAQFSMRPSLAKPQSVPKWQPPKVTSTPSTQEMSKRWSAPVQSNVGKEMTITFGGPGHGQHQKIPIGIASPMAVVSNVPSKQESTFTKYTTRTVTTLQEDTIEDDSDDDNEPHVITKTTRYETKSSEVSEPVSIMDDPSIILRQGFSGKPGDKKKAKMMRPKSFPGAALDEPDLPETDKISACKTIADLLMFPKNKSAKGAKMFAKRRKRSAKYTIEGYGTRPEDEELPQQIGPKTPTDNKAASSGAPPGIPPPPPPPPPTTEPIYIPKLGIHIAPTDFNINMRSKDKCEHKTVSPTQCGMLVADLKGARGKGASMFERRRQRSDKFVLTNEGKNTNVGKENEQSKEGVTLAFIAMHGQEDQQEPVVQPVQPQPPVNLQRKTPWEAASDSPVGSIDSAFNHFPKKSFNGNNSPTSADKPKPPAAWMTKSNMLPKIPAKPPSEPKIKPRFRAGRPLSPSENGHTAPSSMFRPMFDARKQAAENTTKPYKDFNVKARGWSCSPQHSTENTPPSQSPASVHSGDFAGSPGVAASFPTQPLKYGGGYNDFNPKPRQFCGGSYSPSRPSATHNMMESDEL